LRPRNPRHGRQRDGACRQAQKSTAWVLTRRR
jgi:hypothetical protein